MKIFKSQTKLLSSARITTRSKGMASSAPLIGSPQTNSPLKATQPGVNIFQDGTQF
ncbi:hypothetical protein [Mucilaginibacter sp. OK098]|uniref:hypothetical protein n=1 Tax=Mucilaginibacter sp. OK098 TaxID=1855297 RepID=UPI0013563402|nr:hypothetical protein [Mucilaginibacter sp. OK098]